MIFKKLQNRIDTVFMNSENSKRFSLLDLSDKVNLIRMKICCFIKSKFGMMNLSYWSIICIRYSDYFEYIIKKHGV